jgi:hypothetical protein
MPQETLAAAVAVVSAEVAEEPQVASLAVVAVPGQAG